MRNLIVYVKHYLTEEGRTYFRSVWFPLIQSQLSQQPGFLEIKYSECDDTPDCIFIKLKFSDENTFNAWAEGPSHDELLAKLFPYQSRGYLKAVYTTDEDADPDTLNWEVYSWNDLENTPS